MNAPSTDRAGIRQTIRALRAAGYKLDRVFDGEEYIKVRGEEAAIEAITAVDDAFLYVYPMTNDRGGWVRFVLGNSPEEVICDYRSNLEPVIGPLIDGWIA